MGFYRFSRAPDMQLARRQERGFSMMEAMVAAAISVIAIIGLAHTFGLGRAFINRYEVARVALGVAQARMEVLSIEKPVSSDFTIGLHLAAPDSFSFEGRPIGTEQWMVEWFDDPITNPNTSDLKRVTTIVAWGRGADADTIRLTRLFPG